MGYVSNLVFAISAAGSGIAGVKPVQFFVRHGGMMDACDITASASDGLYVV